jgi:hypothetical protein
MQSSPPSSQASVAASRATPPALLLDLNLDTLFDTTKESDDCLHSPGVLAARKGNARLIYDAFDGRRSATNARGVINVTILGILSLGLVFLFLFLPIWLAFHGDALGRPVDAAVDDNAMGANGIKAVKPWASRCVRALQLFCRS